MSSNSPLDFRPGGRGLGLVAEERLDGLVAEESLDAALPAPRSHPPSSNGLGDRPNPAELPTHWLDDERLRREQALLGDRVTALLRDRDYSFILGRAQLQYAVPALTESWRAAQTAIYRLVKACDVLDKDGIALYMPQADAAGRPNFCCHMGVTGQQLPERLKRHLPPEQIPVARVLRQALADYQHRKQAGQTKPNGEIILALFDGEPKEQLDIVRAIVEATHRIDSPQELGIGLLQIGENSIAEGFFSLLEEDLKLAGARHDIVKFRKVKTLNLDGLADFLATVITQDRPRGWDGFPTA